MVGSSHEYDENIEQLIDLLVGATKEEGYEVKRYSEIKGLGVTTYDGLKIKGFDGTVFSVLIDDEINK